MTQAYRMIDIEFRGVKVFIVEKTSKAGRCEWNRWYKEDAPCRATICNWICEFSPGRTSVQDASRPGRPSEIGDIKSAQLKNFPINTADHLARGRLQKSFPLGQLTKEDRKEIEKYQNQSVPTIYKNPLIFWSECKHLFPLLNAISRNFFCIQASSAESERHFSCAGNIATEKRGRLSPDMVEMLSALKVRENCKKNWWTALRIILKKISK